MYCMIIWGWPMGLFFPLMCKLMKADGWERSVSWGTLPPPLYQCWRDWSLIFIYLFLFRWLKLCSVSVTWLLMWTGYFLICKACFDSSSRSEPSNTYSFRYWGSYILLSTIEIKLWFQQIKIHFLIFWMFLVFTQFLLDI